MGLILQTSQITRRKKKRGAYTNQHEAYPVNGCVGRSPLFTALEVPEATAQENTCAACERRCRCRRTTYDGDGTGGKGAGIQRGALDAYSQKIPEQGDYIITRPLLGDMRCDA